jgi:accessory colonization factor AcfC
MPSLAEQEFINQMSRRKMVEWCDWAVKAHKQATSIPEADAVYRDFAVTKKWLSLKNMATGEHTILAAGWDTAARFLKR